MKNLFYILTFLLFILPTSNALACGNSDTQKEDTEMSCCKSHNDHDSEKKSCYDSSDEDGDNDCNGNCNDKNCHCPTSVNIPIPASSFSIQSTPLVVVEKTNWAFIQNAPKPVYLPIWQPPKIS